MSAALPVGRSAEESENCRGAAPETATVLVLAVRDASPRSAAITISLLLSHPFEEDAQSR